MRQAGGAIAPVARIRRTLVMLAPALILALAAGCQPITAGGGSPGPLATGTSAPPAAGSTASPPNGTSGIPEPAGSHIRGLRKSRTGYWLLPGGVILPNGELTPGAANPAVTQANIGATICRTGYTDTIRPDEDYTTGLKRRQLAAGYSYHADMTTGDYEEDHLISLELGGAPSDPMNLWPEPYDGPKGARVKDLIENKLHDLVCSGKLALKVAQRSIAVNWWAALQRYGGEGSPRVWDGSYTAPPSPGSGGSSSKTGPPPGATALCRDGTYSFSTHRSGTCAGHGGVARWLSPA